MRFEQDGLFGSYDEQHDVLYIYYKGRKHSYGKEHPEGIITFKTINSDELSGYLIYDFKKRSAAGELDISSLDYLFRIVVDKLSKKL